VQKAWERKQLATLNWTTVDSDGSLFSRGKHDYYAILVRGIPQERPKDCVIELYVGLIVHKTSHVKGSMHDYTLYKHSHPNLPDNVRLDLDLGYLGIRDDYPKLNCMLPFKKKNPGRGKRGVKAQELSVEQRASNMALVKERVVVEHTNSRVKKFHIFGDEFRNRLKRYDVMTDIVCGLVNFRIAGTLVI
jgi:hypothetical protein